MWWGLWSGWSGIVSSLLVTWHRLSSTSSSLGRPLDLISGFSISIHHDLCEACPAFLGVSLVLDSSLSCLAAWTPFRVSVLL